MIDLSVYKKLPGFLTRFMPPAKSRRPVLLHRRETLEYALAHNCSVARFGDGELEFALRGTRRGFEGIHFQKADRTLSSRLGEILTEPVDGLLVCFNNSFMQQARHHIVLDYERSPQKCYAEVLSLKKEKDIGVLERKNQQRFYRKRFAAICRRTRLSRLGEATCFSLCFFLEEYLNGQIPEICELYRRFFKDRRILFVAPETPVLGESFRSLVDRGVIRSPKKVDFLSIPERNCFEHYARILEGILKYRHLDAVFLQAGPTATVLASELRAEHGLLAYDVGSLNVSLQKAAAVHNISF